ncbi:unnamed protein product [Ceutorhynchus assimilis]|uniref:Uncharacterized protein n=1 Tax=Ceutorhynchus assimilis TaxID=467358 RepID=A0A9N9MFW0_9CUCU|nr:unnamed protein product [Ceutorhynchus assimilis]
MFIPNDDGKAVTRERILKRLQVGNHGLNTDLWSLGNSKLTRARNSTMNSRSSRTKRLLKLAALKFKETQDYSNDDAIQETIETENKENILPDNLPPVNLDEDKEGRILCSSMGRPNPSPSNLVGDQEVCTNNASPNLDSPNLLQANLVEDDSACNNKASTSLGHPNLSPANLLEEQEAYTYQTSCSADRPNISPVNLAEDEDACTNKVFSNLGSPNLSSGNPLEDQEAYTYKASCSSDFPNVLPAKLVENVNACTNEASSSLGHPNLSPANLLEDQEAYIHKASCSSDHPNVLPANLVENEHAYTNEASSSLGHHNLSPSSLLEDQEAYTYKASCSSDRPMVLRFQRLEGNKYIISPIHSGESDVDDSDADPNYNNSTSESDTDREGMIEEDDSNQEESKKKGKKRKANPEAWSFKKAKYLRNSGKAYTSASKNKKKFCERKVRSPCGDKSTLDLNDRPIRTALKKKTENGFLESDKRGKHGKHPTVDPSIKESVRAFIDKIPRVESHYLRAQTKREYIESGKSLADLHRDYKEERQSQQLGYANSVMFNRIFNGEFNIGFYSPKKDQCDLCESYKNSDEQGKLKLQESYDLHLKEKVLSRKEKDADKLNQDGAHVAVYDLQAVMPVPRGLVSSFYYKNCYFWNETEGKRGATEIGSCVLYYLKELSENAENDNLDVILYIQTTAPASKKINI